MMKTRRFFRTAPLYVTVMVFLIFIGNTGANAANGQQVALIIGNGDYAVNPIGTAVNDARAITTSLKELGYDVFLRNNLDRERMLNTVNAFEKALAGAELGLFFYMGHGVQYENANYLVPLGAHVESDWQIPETCIALNDITETVTRSGVKTAVFIIDGARPHPLGTRFSPAESGLAEMATPKNLHLFLADAPNHLTRQGVGPLPDADSTSSFASTFLALFKEVPDLSISQFMQQLQLAVAVKSRQDRNPWYRLGKDDSISLYDSQALFAKQLESLPKDGSLDQAQAFMSSALNVSTTPTPEDQKRDLKNPWTDNPILVLHTLLRDLEKFYEVERAGLSENFYQAGVSALKTKYSYLEENDTAPWTPALLLKNTLTRTWPWPDPFLSPELAAKTAAAEAAKAAKEAEEAEALSDETDHDVKKADKKEPASIKKTKSKPESLPEGESEPLDPIDTTPIVRVNPAIAQFKTSLILARHKEMLKASRLPEQVKRTALATIDDHAQELNISTASSALLFEKAMSIYYQQNRMALIISDGETGSVSEALIPALEETGFSVTTTTPSMWHDDIELQNEKLKAGDVGLIYVTSNGISLEDLVDFGTPSINSLNIVIMDPALSSDIPPKPIESVDTLPENMVILLTDTPTELKKDADTPKKTLPAKTPSFVWPEGPVMARALAKHLEIPGQKLTPIFQKIQSDVKTTTENRLNPWWIYGSDVINTPFQFNDSNQKFVHLLVQLEIFRYLEATGAVSELFDNGWKALVRDHPDWTWFVGKGDLGTVLQRAFAGDRADERHTIALKQGRLPRFTNEQGMTFIYQPSGSFMMGSSRDEAGRAEDELIAETTIDSGYYLMQTEVTQAQWKAVMGQNAASFSDCGPHCPVETVSWHDVNAFIKRLNGVDVSQTSVLPAAFKKRWQEQFNQSIWHTFSSELDLYLRLVGSGKFFYGLPTEAQWEFACRSGRQTWFGFGSELWRLPEYAWYNENASHSTQPVATKRAHKNGFYDLHGNVWEWCQDGQGRFKTVRGGSWYYDALSARCAKRYYVKPTDANYNIGLRLAAVPRPAR